MKNKIRFFKKIKLFIQWLKNNPDFDREFAPKTSHLDACYSEGKSLHENTCMCIPWPNGEGYQFIWFDTNGEKNIGVTNGEIETMLDCLDYHKFFEKE
jgi:hypothetical protein